MGVAKDGLAANQRAPALAKASYARPLMDFYRANLGIAA